MTISIHLVEWLILLAGVGAAMVRPTAVTAAESDDVREPLDVVLARIVRRDDDRPVGAPASP